MEKPIEVAIIMAAGLGSRMLPLTKEIAKPLVPVFGVPMIETLISALNMRGVIKIYVVVGYKKEQFDYLVDKYDNVELIENKEYLDKNNISSIRAVASVLGQENCFICEGDLYVKDSDIFMREMGESGHFGRFVEGYSSDWVFEQEDDLIVRIKKGGSNLYNMTGVSYWLKEDVHRISKTIGDAYLNPGHENLFWDEIVDGLLQEIKVTVYPIQQGQILEIDTVEELVQVEKGV